MTVALIPSWSSWVRMCRAFPGGRNINHLYLNQPLKAKRFSLNHEVFQFVWHLGKLHEGRDNATWLPRICCKQEFQWNILIKRSAWIAQAAVWIHFSLAFDTYFTGIVYAERPIYFYLEISNNRNCLNSNKLLLDHPDGSVAMVIPHLYSAVL